MNSCQQCKYLNKKPFTRNGWDKFITWECTKSRNYQIAHDVKDPYSIKIPNWCPIENEKWKKRDIIINKIIN